MKEISLDGKDQHLVSAFPQLKKLIIYHEISRESMENLCKVIASHQHLAFLHLNDAACSAARGWKKKSLSQTS